MKNIAEFIAQIENDKCTYNAWVYAKEGCYKQLQCSDTKNCYSYLREMVEYHLQIVIELNNNKLDSYLLLSEINVVTHIAFNNQKVIGIAA
ncbi:hypothetical protein [Photobacterium iliopiscarium]|uniref:hypothetical protein n=1 Tax=Photobacterium iliopiscarium TaxID=56192 RepID=UPI001E2ABE50|nr:hypothetical protein [Photobacterium iliopiscarium]MCD9466048.1 hypothetical protein [Photobacterium iliopiscarium]MCD9486516.1 hypothetical protein [Photobacterium iliopiscarium]MCF2243125.1 hypothetical protein [Photobacterium iliopiscarium]